ncbi:hypothetical protein KGQ20_24880 [Catenulispora sp. NF23]|uniref:Integral membrane protein n=1 Tax=Catenulispora pinistramenti TaxID=2705254 RepID=A0ABS5KJH7_9ACTN|nr:hypothetical protein [Catenulispora pinistramenti]MBS2536002.1 hypothetical protein [Catenulispora pinistramenti]MBS2546458.1 hypothetical protein [Catenulispora pinistramenti]
MSDAMPTAKTATATATETGAEPPTPTLRAGRAVVFAALCVLVGAVGHDAFSVGGIPVWALLVGGGATFVVVQPFTRRERGLPVILALMAAVQVGLHELFAAAQRGSGSMSMPMAMPARGRFWCGHSEPPGVTQAVHNAAGATPSQHSMTVGMWAAHIVAALVAAWWLRRGEAAVWSLARTLGLALVAPLVLLVAALVPWTPPRLAVGAPVTTAPARLGPGRLLRFELARRGPPMTAAAFC